MNKIIAHFKKNPYHLFILVLVLAVIYLLYKQGFFKPAKDRGRLIDVPEDVENIGGGNLAIGQGYLSDNEITNRCLSFYNAFDGWTFASAGIIEEMSRANALSNADLVRMHNKFIQMYQGKTMRKVVTDETIILDATIQVRDLFLNRLSSLNL